MKSKAFLLSLLVFQFLREAIQVGWRDVERLKTTSALTALHDDPRWVKVVAECEAAERKYLQEHNDPNKARFVTEDIARFWKAYDKAMTADPTERAAIFQRDYIEPGSIGLKDFARSGRLDAKGLATAIEKRPEFFKAIRPLTTGIDKYRAETLAAFRKLKQLYPDALFPDAYFVIGQLMSGGTASKNGLLMGAEMFTRATATPMAELNDWEKGALMEQGELAPLIAHEAIHFQQKYASQDTLLCRCLKEGSADFLGELTSGRMVKRMRETHVWANARERELWEEFQKDMERNDNARWLYGGSGGNGRPVDLGYWMGYRIAAAYYQNAKNKKQAVRDMLLVKDCKEFLKASRYAEKFGASPRPVMPLPEVEKRDTGPIKLLLIPCISCRWQAWEDFMARNLDRYTMYAVTLPGYGGTPVPDLPRNTEGTPWRDNALAALSQLIDRERLKDLTVVGHSWGTMVAVQLAARRPDAIVRLVAVDGSIESTTWTPATREERLAQARQVIESYGAKLRDAEEWRKFNAVPLPPGEMIDRAEVLRLLKRHGSFMATDRDVMLQYWRENLLIDLTGFVKQLKIPLLDLKALRGKDQQQQRAQHRKDLQTAGVPPQVQTVFLYETRHFLMDHRPEVFDRLLADFVAGRKLPESVPAP